jgi:inner membrane protein
MPTVLSHVLVAFTGARLLRLDPKLTGAAVACAVVPDLDVFTPALGVPWSSFLAHRGFTHTLGFALLLGIAIALLALLGAGALHAAGRLRAGQPRVLRR